MDRETLAKLWQDNNDRPAWVMENREVLEDHIDTSDPIPANGSLHEIRQWLGQYKGTVTKQLNAAETPEADAE